MSDFIILIILMIFSGGGIVCLVINRLKAARLMGERELIIKIQESKSLLADFYEKVINPTVNFWRKSLLPPLYKEFEKIISRFRINVLKIESWLLKLTNYIRGKRNVQSNNHHSQYWKEMNDFKNGLK